MEIYENLISKTTQWKYMKNEALFYAIISWIQCFKSPLLWNGGGTPIYTMRGDNKLIMMIH